MSTLDEKKFLNADGFLHDCWRLAAKVRRSGWQPDLLLGLWRGGAPVAVAMHEFFKISGWEVDHLPLKCASYSGIGTGSNDGDVKFFCEEPIFAAIHAGMKVLVVDDVFDTGKTMAAMTQRLQALHAEMRTACVYYKPAKNQTEITPDFYVEDVGLDWLVFPHEIEGLNQAEIVRKDPLLAELLALQS